MRDVLPKQHADHEALRLAGFDRFALDRLAVEGLQPMGAELNRLLGVLDRLATPASNSWLKTTDVDHEPRGRC